MGCRFAKWRTCIKIGNGCPSDISIRETAQSLAKYGSICQSNGLVPIIEPEILMDGDHSIELCAEVSEKVFLAVFD
jgi:fructose-bisphosphate aldolase class I